LHAAANEGKRRLLEFGFPHGTLEDSSKQGAAGLGTYTPYVRGPGSDAGAGSHHQSAATALAFSRVEEDP
jgi:hypothetical protein